MGENRGPETTNREREGIMAGWVSIAKRLWRKDGAKTAERDCGRWMAVMDPLQHIRREQIGSM